MPLRENLIKLAVGIVRRSDIKQKNNASLETQSEEIYARAELEGYQIVKIFIDDANSAYHKKVTERKAMTDLLQMVLSDENQIEAVFFYEESRVSRQFYDFTLYIHDVIKKEKPNTKFFSTSKQGEWDPYDVVTVINFATAANDSIKKSARAKDAQQTSLKKQERPGSDVPNGYKLVYDSERDEFSNLKPKAEQVIHPTQASIVLFIFYLTSWGHRQQKITDLLNEMEIPSPKNRKWSSGTVDYILNNDQYLGHLPWNIRSHLNTSRKKQRGEYDLILNHHEPIVSIQLWNLTHQTIKLHKENGKNNDTPFFLRDLLFCKDCESALIARNNTPKNAKKKYLIYRCPSCKNQLNAEEIHTEIMNELTSKWLMLVSTMSNEVIDLLSKRKGKLVQHRDAIQEQLQQIKLKEDFLHHSPEKVKDSSNWDFILSVSKSKLKQELMEANSFIEHIELLEQDFQANQLFSFFKKMNIEKLENTEIRTIFLTFFKRITVDFKSGNHLFVHYKLAPFTEIDQYFESITSD